MRHNNDSSDTLLDPVCGSSTFLRDTFALFFDAYNKVPLAGFQSQSSSQMQSGPQSIERALQLAKRLPLQQRHLPILQGVPTGLNVVPDIILSSIPLDALTVDSLCLMLVPPTTRTTTGTLLRRDHQLTEARPYHPSKRRRLWQFEDGEWLEGACAEWKGEGVHVKLVPRNAKLYGPGSVVFYVNFSVASILGRGDNSWPADSRAMEGVIDIVQGILHKMGITTDLRQAQITRCDLNRNMVMDEPIENYREVWDALHTPRTTKETWPRTGMLCQNKSQALSIYDKIVAMKKNGVSTGHLPPHLMRLEWRVMGAANVRKKLGLNTVQDLISRYEALPDLFTDHLKKVLFRYDVVDLKAPRRRSDSRVYSPTQAQVFNLVRWCRKHQITLDLTKPQLHRTLGEEGVEGYARTIKLIPGMYPKHRKHATDAVRSMRRAWWHEKVVTDADFARRYEELRSKVEGGRCWPARHW